MSDTVPVLGHVDEYLSLAQEYNVSDVHIAPFAQPKWRRFGLLQPIWENAEQLTPEDTERLARTKLEAAIEKFKAFHVELCHLRVLDPACGSGNFLVVTFDLFKQLEAEVIQRLRDLGENQVGAALNVKGATVTPAQFLGIEKNPRAREIAELVLWIGYLQWYRRTKGSVQPPEPVLHAYGNIECRDAVLAYDAVEMLLDERGKPVKSRRLRARSPSSGWTRRKPRETARRRARLRPTRARTSDASIANAPKPKPPSALVSTLAASAMVGTCRATGRETRSEARP
jgi:hypothetical protein